MAITGIALRDETAELIEVGGECLGDAAGSLMRTRRGPKDAREKHMAMRWSS